ncbi:hypothetical protein GNI_070890 [Gregarina niphandrodes]|uniref:Uncharacterized protein n=1 Tax=Gregarina niphandrodes TaxID=110365 RepID=A0A023B7A8_GRENI|nr:hypothetical protein GNI_070890 [Gregarina niphandrodes]EZG67183.1 hypothetical protein GNI_070890 [Gregarina niphandrodes]|eukprot:XP_011130312.1 hypothetical protein GNI_070890 [Gregarina niphandrodes]
MRTVSTAPAESSHTWPATNYPDTIYDDTTDMVSSIATTSSVTTSSRSTSSRSTSSGSTSSRPTSGRSTSRSTSQSESATTDWFGTEYGSSEPATSEPFMTSWMELSTSLESSSKEADLVVVVPPDVLDKTEPAYSPHTYETEEGDVVEVTIPHPRSRTEASDTTEQSPVQIAPRPNTTQPLPQEPTTKAATTKPLTTQPSATSPQGTSTTERFTWSNTPVWTEAGDWSTQSEDWSTSSVALPLDPSSTTSVVTSTQGTPSTVRSTRQPTVKPSSAPETIPTSTRAATPTAAPTVPRGATVVPVAAPSTTMASLHSSAPSVKTGSTFLGATSGVEPTTRTSVATVTSTGAATTRGAMTTTGAGTTTEEGGGWTTGVDFWTTWDESLLRTGELSSSEPMSTDAEEVRVRPDLLWNDLDVKRRGSINLPDPVDSARLTKKSQVRALVNGNYRFVQEFGSKAAGVMADALIGEYYKRMTGQVGPTVNEVSLLMVYLHGVLKRQERAVFTVIGMIHAFGEPPCEVPHLGPVICETLKPVLEGAIDSIDEYSWSLDAAKFGGLLDAIDSTNHQIQSESKGLYSHERTNDGVDILQLQSFYDTDRSRDASLRAGSLRAGSLRIQTDRPGMAETYEQHGLRGGYPRVSQFSGAVASNQDSKWIQYWPAIENMLATF